MKDKDQDIFGKIDAMLEKRDAEVLADKCIVNDDFPTLTDVIANELGLSSVETNNKSRSQAIDSRRLADRRIRQRRQLIRTDTNLLFLREELEPLVSAVERRLCELIVRQQLDLEETLTRLIRDALGTRANGKQ